MNTTDTRAAPDVASEARSVEMAKWQRIADCAAPERTQEYYSCQALERGMIFYPERITACCTRHSDGTRGEPILANYSGGPLPVKAMMTERKRILDSHMKGEIHPECKACPNLKKQAWGYNEWLVDMVTVAHYTHCNLKCPYCDWEREPWRLMKPRDNYKVIPVLTEMIEQGILAPYAEIRFSGGEPTMLKEFPSIMELIVGHGCLARVYTNATLRSQNIIDALNKGRASLVLGLDAGSREAYLRVKGRDEVERAWKHATEYASIDADNVWAKMIVRYDNTDDVDAFVARCEQAGITRVYYDMDMYAREKPEHLDEVISAVARLKYECAKRGFETFCGEAGTQNLVDINVIEEIEKRMVKLAQSSDEGRAFLANRRLRDEYGLDVSPYEKAGSKFGPAYVTEMKRLLATLASVG